MSALTIEEAYRKWGDELVRYAAAAGGAAQAHDLVADVFTALLRRGEESWIGLRDQRSYVYRMITNRARSQARSIGRRTRREELFAAAQVAGSEWLADPIVLRALTRLSVRQRSVLFLSYWNDLAPSDIAGLLGISEGAVKRHLARGRKSLREVLDETVT